MEEMDVTAGNGQEAVDRPFPGLTAVLEPCGVV